MTARDPAFAAHLRAVVRGQVKEAEPLARYTTYRIGGPATVCIPADGEAVGAALRLAADAGVPVFALGLGSNVLLPDTGMTALVLRLGKGLDAVRQEGERWWFGAGLPAPLAARRTAEAGWAGLHVMVGVPGSVGGGIAMNAGCHGGEWSDVTRAVTVVDASGVDRVLPASDIPFGYRRSGLEGVVVVEVEVALSAEDPHALAERTRALYEWRQQGTPFNQPCCGSVFRNPPPDMFPEGRSRTAGQLIEAAGLKGRRLGGAEISAMHANYFVNIGGASARDVEDLILLAQGAVAERFGVQLHPEVKLVSPDGTFRPLPG